MNSVESLAEEAELALSSWTCYIMELGGPYGVEMNFLMKKKEIPSCITVENLLKHSFPSCFCPCHLSPNDLRNTQVSKTAPCDTTARHQILGRIERAWGLSSGFHSLPKTGYCYAGNLLLVLCHAALPATPQAIVSPGVQLGAWAWLQG